MRHLGRFLPVLVALALTALVLGPAAAVATVAVHRSAPGLLLGVAATVATIRALRDWVPRAATAFAAGWLVVLVAAVAGRGEGDYVVSSDLLGWLLIGSGFVVLVTGLAWGRPAAVPDDSGSAGAFT
jgi:peptidoglycan/LPS O-acetylase OafA/YrhL